uniref:Uncharacterized protein n=1 Tax=Arundo donax TaxID=35708 RepID=A0A0A8YRF8_ARUDO
MMHIMQQTVWHQKFLCLPMDISTFIFYLAVLLTCYMIVVHLIKCAKSYFQVSWDPHQI